MQAPAIAFGGAILLALAGEPSRGLEKAADRHGPLTLRHGAWGQVAGGVRSPWLSAIARPAKIQIR
jgi:hypothetical protein